MHRPWTELFHVKTSLKMSNNIREKKETHSETKINLLTETQNLSLKKKKKKEYFIYLFLIQRIASLVLV